MLRVSKVDWWPARQRDAEPVRPGLRNPGNCVIIRSSGGPPEGHPAPPRGLHLVMIPPGTRGLPHLHAGHETAVYVVSGQAEVWHGAGFARRSLVRAGDFVYVPPGAPHLTVNTGDVTSIAVVAGTDYAGTDYAGTDYAGTDYAGTDSAGTDSAGQAGSVMMELPRHLASLLEIPVGSGA